MTDHHDYATDRVSIRELGVRMLEVAERQLSDARSRAPEGSVLVQTALAARDLYERALEELDAEAGDAAMSARFRTPFNAIEPGDVLRADGGFTCIVEGDLVMVQADKNGDLYVTCDDGRHMLDGQCDGDDMCVGFRRWG